MRFTALCLVLIGAVIVGLYTVGGIAPDSFRRPNTIPTAPKIDAIATGPILGGIAIVFGLLLLVMGNKTKDDTI